MRQLLYAFVVIGLAVLCMPLESFAQDTVTVVPSTWNTFINSDTLAGGVRANPDRVYRFRRGLVYQVSEPLRINGKFTAVANDSPGVRPPVLAPAIRLDNSSVDYFFEIIGKGSKISVSNLYLLSQRSDNVWLGWSDAFRINADSVSLKMRGVIGEGFSNCFVVPSFHMKTDWQDCIFRNQQHASSWFGGQVFRGAGGVALDTTIMINNTFFANNSYLIDIRGYTPLAIFEHNTCVYGVVNPFLTRQASNTHIKNNIFYAMHAFGGNPTHVFDGWFLNYPDTGASGIVQFRAQDSVSYWANLWWNTGANTPSVLTGPEVWVDATHGITLDMLDPTKRVFDMRNNNFFLPQRLVDFYQAYNDTVASVDSISVPVYQSAPAREPYKRTMTLPVWMTSHTKWQLDSLLLGSLGQGIVIDRVPIMDDPGFPTDITSHVEQLIGYIHRISTNTLSSARWTYPDTTLYLPDWPLPENLAYSNTALQSAGTDGFALGDLNWFPTQKAAWILTDVKKTDNVVPVEFSLEQNYPNPFNPATKIEFSLPKQSKVTLTVYNLLGQEVASLVNTTLGAGRYSSEFDASKLASGTYIYRLVADGFVKTSKMLLLK